MTDRPHDITADKRHDRIKRCYIGIEQYTDKSVFVNSKGIAVNVKALGKQYKKNKTCDHHDSGYKIDEFKQSKYLFFTAVFTSACMNTIKQEKAYTHPAHIIHIDCQVRLKMQKAGKKAGA